MIGEDRPLPRASNLRPAPAFLTPVKVDAIIALADMLRTADAARNAPKAYDGPYPIRGGLTVAEWPRGGGA
jgi:hypothetical protein